MKDIDKDVKRCLCVCLTPMFPTSDITIYTGGRIAHSNRGGTKILMTIPKIRITIGRVTIRGLSSTLISVES